MDKPEKSKRGPHFHSTAKPVTSPSAAKMLFWGMAVRECIALVGRKRAIFDGETLFLSPAMHELLVKAESAEETERLLRAFDPIRIPKFDPLKIQLDLETVPFAD